jgi:hypothetical protein
MERVARQVPANRRMEMAVHDKSAPWPPTAGTCRQRFNGMRRRQPALPVKDHHEQTFEARSPRDSLERVVQPVAATRELLHHASDDEAIDRNYAAHHAFLD